ncbi:MAG TPA: alpha/beta fold hydrolase [Propionicimonas sp.]|nr:alpha/beta fold hydrolase [Propionicimonas sp.]
MVSLLEFEETQVAVVGGTLACHTVGTGEGLVIVHGAMQSGTSQADLAALLAPRYTVHLIDRRGRGRGTAPLASTPDLEVDDLQAVVEATGARRVMGVSSGAILSARLALRIPSLERLVLFEPPLSIDDSMRLGRTAAFDAAIADGQLGRAMAVAMRIAEMGPPWMFRLPIPLLAMMSKRMLTPEREPLALGLEADVAIIRANAEHVADFAAIATPTLVLDGTATRPYLRKAAAALTATIPGAQRVSLEGLFHAATQNRDEFGSPDAVLPTLLDFLA